MNILEAFDSIKKGKIVRVEYGENEVDYWSASKESRFGKEGEDYTFYEVDRETYSDKKPNSNKLESSCLYRVCVEAILQGKFSVITFEKMAEEMLIHWEKEQEEEKNRKS
jgi:hypothetical protein